MAPFVVHRLGLAGQRKTMFRASTRRLLVLSPKGPASPLHLTCVTEFPQAWRYKDSRKFLEVAGKRLCPQFPPASALWFAALAEGRSQRRLATAPA